jgi:hypothetical protein
VFKLIKPGPPPTCMASRPRFYSAEMLILMLVDLFFVCLSAVDPLRALSEHKQQITLDLGEFRFSVSAPKLQPNPFHFG